MGPMKKNQKRSGAENGEAKMLLCDVSSYDNKPGLGLNWLQNLKVVKIWAVKFE